NSRRNRRLFFAVKGLLSGIFILVYGLIVFRGVRCNFDFLKGESLCASPGMYLIFNTRLTGFIHISFIRNISSVEKHTKRFLMAY
ncbi:MAG TPA: hypothetical protein VFF57_12730, partial [Hanamia sp.]|nr:hypothetical protein [Hanamia sp.]